MSATNRATVEIHVDDQTARGLATAEASVKSKLEQISNGFGRINAALTALGKGIDAPVRAAVNGFAQFDAAIRAVGATAHATITETQRLTDAAAAIGAGGIFGTGDATAGMNVLARMGFDPAFITATTAGIADLAQVTGSALPQAADTAGRMFKAFGDNTATAGNTLDALTYITTNTSLRLEDMRAIIGRIAPAIQAAKLSMQDALAVMGALAQSGMGAEKAGQAAEQIFKAIAAGQMTLNDVDGAADFGEQLAANMGATATAAAKMNAGVQGALNDMGGAVSELSRTWGEALAPSAEAMARAVETVCRAVSGVITEFPRATALVTKLALAFAGYATIKSTLQTLTTIKSAVEKLAPATTAATAATAKMATAQTVSTTIYTNGTRVILLNNAALASNSTAMVAATATRTAAKTVIVAATTATDANTAATAANTAAADANAAAAERQASRVSKLNAAMAILASVAIGAQIGSAAGEWWKDTDAGIPDAKNAALAAQDAATAASKHTDVVRQTGDAAQITAAVQEEAKAYNTLAQRLNDYHRAVALRRRGVIGEDNAEEKLRPIAAAQDEANERATALFAEANGKTAAGTADTTRITAAAFVELAQKATEAKKQQAAMEEKLAAASRSRLENEIAAIDKEFAKYQELTAIQLAFEEAKKTQDQAKIAALEKQLNDAQKKRDERVRQVTAAHTDALAQEVARARADFAKAEKAIADNAARAAEDKAISTQAATDPQGALARAKELHTVAGASKTAAAGEIEGILSQMDGVGTDREKLKTLQDALAKARDNWAQAAGRENTLAQTIADLENQTRAAAKKAQELGTRLDVIDTGRAQAQAGAQIDNAFSTAEKHHDTAAMQAVLSPLQAAASAMRDTFAATHTAAAADGVISDKEAALLSAQESAYRDLTTRADNFAARLTEAQAAANVDASGFGYSTRSAYADLLKNTAADRTAIATETTATQIKQAVTILTAIQENGGSTFE